MEKQLMLEFVEKGEELFSKMVKVLKGEDVSVSSEKESVVFNLEGFEKLDFDKVQTGDHVIKVVNGIVVEVNSKRVDIKFGDDEFASLSKDALEKSNVFICPAPAEVEESKSEETTQRKPSRPKKEKPVEEEVAEPEEIEEEEEDVIWEHAAFSEVEKNDVVREPNTGDVGEVIKVTKNKIEVQYETETTTYDEEEYDDAGLEIQYMLTDEKIEEEKEPEDEEEEEPKPKGKKVKEEEIDKKEETYKEVEDLIQADVEVLDKESKVFVRSKKGDLWEGKVVDKSKRQVELKFKEPFAKKFNTVFRQRGLEKHKILMLDPDLD